MGQRVKRITAADIAREVGVSRATVGFVLNDTPGQTISQGTRERVLAAARTLGYRPHTAARALASGRSHIMLLILPDWPLDHSMRENIDQASAELDRAGYSLITTAPHRGGHAPPLWRTLSPDVVLSFLPLSTEQIAAMRDAGVDHIVPPDLPAGTEHTDEVEASSGAGFMSRFAFSQGPALQVEHLQQRGCRRIAFAGSGDSRLAELNTLRRDLAAHAAERFSVEWLEHADMVEGNAAEIVARWNQQGVDGVVAYNDDIAALTVGAAVRQGIAVPAELAVIGHDDTPMARLLVPSLTSIRIDLADLGRYMAALALAVLDETVMPLPEPDAVATVVERESTQR